MSALQCERLVAETTTERDTRFYSEWETDYHWRNGWQVSIWQNKTWRTVDCSVAAASFQQHSIQANMPCIGYISFMLASFPDPCACHKKGPPQKWTPGTNISEKFGPLELFFFSKIGQNIWTPYEKIGPCGTYFSNNILDSMELIFQDSWKIRPIWNYNWKIWTPLILCDLRTNSLHS